MQTPEPKPKTSTERVRRHHAQMRARGLRRVTVWVSTDEPAAHVAEVLRQARSKGAWRERLGEGELADALLAAFEAR